MTALDDSLVPNEEKVTVEVIDGEAIMINLVTGNYYSMDKVGAFIWTKVVQGLSLEKIAAAVMARYEVSQEQARTDVLRLAGELLREEVVRIAKHHGGPDEGAVVSSVGSKDRYETPSLNVYKDLGDLLALDPPIPELKEGGWKGPGDGSSGPDG